MPNQTLNWEDYASRYNEEAELQGYPPSYITKCLTYAQKLNNQGLPIIFDGKHLCNLVGYRPAYVFAASNAQDAHYRHFEILKKNGSPRKISEPLPSLKEIQRWLLANVFDPIPVSKFAKAFKQGSSIKSNARFHKGQAQVLCLDIKDFFGNIHTNSVVKILCNVGYSVSVSVLIANLCTLNDSLPQGAPTSPAISNIFMNKFDSRIASFCLRRDIRYTRYADDLTFSGDLHPDWVIRFVRKCLSGMLLTLNDSKTRLLKRNKQQLVTGVVVNVKLQATRHLRRKLRQEIYYIKHFGLSSHLAFTKNHFGRHVEHLMGIANFILFLNNNDLEATATLAYLKSLYKEL